MALYFNLREYVMLHRCFLFFAFASGISLMGFVKGEENLDFKLQLQNKDADSGEYVMEHREERWLARQTAIIVCDVWDYHHCYNAVKRLEEFAPRLNQTVVKARQLGCTVIHAPSDCMDAYQTHPARIRAVENPVAAFLPHAIREWCSQIPAEEMVVYPIDQSDGGEDDNPEDHEKWAKQLERLGRNPKMPWKEQLATIEIDPAVDYISDRGDEVWSILEARGIRNVILTGVHVNMCVLGRPFGLRQLARNGKNVVLMRDMTDSMYNPNQWPYVSHHEGTRRIITHIERHICPTVTSDQLLGGEPFHWKESGNPKNDGDHSSETSEFRGRENPRVNWKRVRFSEVNDSLKDLQLNKGEVAWFRRVIKLGEVAERSVTRLKLFGDTGGTAWLDGVPLKRLSSTAESSIFEFPTEHIQHNDYYLLAIARSEMNDVTTPELLINDVATKLEGQWECRIASRDVGFLGQIPLPAKFGGSADIVYESQDPCWIPRVMTRAFEFTKGIEGPACDQNGMLYAVNYQSEGTIGLVTPSGDADLFVRLPAGSVGNGIRFERSGEMLVADYTKHQVLRVDPTSRRVTIHAQDKRMHQPNDLALSNDGQTLYASDPDWENGEGSIWRIDPNGACECVASGLGTTNGIEISPDGKNLYVNETNQRKIWSYPIEEDGRLGSRKCLCSFADHGLDGMRCDVDGNLYVTRYGKGTVVKVSPAGKILKEIPTLGRRPSNLCFGGSDRCTLYVTEVEYQRIVAIRVDRPGRE